MGRRVQDPGGGRLPRLPHECRQPALGHSCSPLGGGTGCWVPGKEGCGRLAEILRLGCALSAVDCLAQDGALSLPWRPGPGRTVTHLLPAACLLRLGSTLGLACCFFFPKKPILVPVTLRERALEPEVLVVVISEFPVMMTKIVRRFPLPELPASSPPLGAACLLFAFWE